MRFIGGLTALSALALSMSGEAVSQTKPAPAIADYEGLLPYIEPGQLVDIGGRRLNLKCSGSGLPTVVLMAGLGSWSPVWFSTQPEIAKRTHVCTFDRAAYGFSDAPPKPQVLSDVPEDLHRALKAANLPGPYILIGHSVGGLEARMFAERWPEEVAGMVLVDTSLAAQSLNQAKWPQFDESEKRTSQALRCTSLAVRKPLEPSDPEYPDCTTALPPGTPAAFRQAWPQFFSADYAAAQLSLSAALYTHRYDSADHIHLGD